MSKALNYIGIARKAGVLETGEENAGMEIRAGKAKLLVLAADASDNARHRAEGFVFETNVPLVVSPLTKEEISFTTGKNGCSMLVFKDIGLAERFVQALWTEHGDVYQALALEMKTRAEKAAQRQKEAKAHQRNKKLGKRRNNI